MTFLERRGFSASRSREGESDAVAGASRCSTKDVNPEMLTKSGPGDVGIEMLPKVLLRAP